MGMKGFSDEFQSPEHYIIDITYRIWEERGLERIRDWYSDDCPVKTPMSFSVGVDPVIAGTQATLDEFPDRHLLADDVIIGDWDDEVFTPRTGFVHRHINLAQDCLVRPPATLCPSPC